MGLTIVSTIYAFCSPHCLPSPPPQHLNPLFLNQSPAKAGHGQLYPPTLSPHSFAMLQQSPGNISIRELVCRESERVAGGEGWRSGIEWGKREMEGRGGGGGEGGFFGKGANPITGSGAAPVSLAALNSHFNGLFLPPPSTFLLLLLSLFLLCYSFFFLITAQTPH